MFIFFKQELIMKLNYSSVEAFGCLFLFNKGIKTNAKIPATITIPVFTTHINQPNERPVVLGISYMLKVCITKNGKAPKRIVLTF